MIDMRMANLDVGVLHKLVMVGHMDDKESRIS